MESGMRCQAPVNRQSALVSSRMPRSYKPGVRAGQAPRIWLGGSGAKVPTLAAGRARSGPKFQRFVSLQELQKQQNLQNYRAVVELPKSDKSILIKPLNSIWVSKAAALLADTFCEAMRYPTIYTGYLSRSITSYLRDHLKYSPQKCVILVALLQEDGGVPAGAGEDGTQRVAEDAAVADPWLAAAIAANPAGGPAPPPPLTLPGGGERGNAAAPSPGELPPGWIPINAAMRPQAQAAPADPGSPDLPPGWIPINAPMPPQAQAAVAAAAAQRQEAAGRSPAGAGPSSAAASQSAASDAAAVDSSSQGQDAKSPTLVGTVEISLDPSTRSTYWTLNPPKAGAYLCNMAVQAEQQCQGIGTALLHSAEAIAQLSGESECYLHVRMKDRPAGALYRKGGYTTLKEDTPLVWVIGQDRRRLMHKTLPPAAGGDGCDGVVGVDPSE